jgi:hypothetical protein
VVHVHEHEIETALASEHLDHVHQVLVPQLLQSTHNSHLTEPPCNIHLNTVMHHITTFQSTTTTYTLVVR